MTTVLVSGAGVAGPALAWWLHRRGLVPTVVERRPALRAGDGGHAVDLFGPAVEVVARMGLADAVRDARTRTETLAWVRPGRRPVEVDVEALSAGVSDRHVEVLRGDLVSLLVAATRDDVEYVLGDEVTALTDSGSGVEVTLASGAQRVVDLVVGADGLHSGVRRLVFGEVPELFLGGYLAVFSLPWEQLGGRALALADVGRSVALYGVGDGSRARAVLLLRTDRELPVDHRDLAGQRELVREAFGDLGWEVPRLLRALPEAEDFYLDAISQVRMDTWSRGRVTLVGDAGYCPGPAVGGGTSLAVVGAHLLAAAVAGAGRDPAAGLAAYERAMAEPVRQSRRIGPAVLRTLVPGSRAQARLTPLVLRSLASLPGPLRRRLTSYGGGPARMLDAVVLPASPGPAVSS
ncbi:2-polyprenyl-6-methoxyphenol hydroxylase [Geodermatophilus telluris]|uniref:2-polyprenyl-6-methoxyphenol hydroxylase n=1 Tax=Geodermatophilus telluris TaxID=1190417 RepID=A0A1G6LQZ1_9ACTN|nr:FAD-dependent monooxygenase [Geodermatophilus telluris]SDC45708.1 2-polyprenyl-6-methoxyphenol hydroxylase [Geodermatophilus telluris]